MGNRREMGKGDNLGGVSIVTSLDERGIFELTDGKFSAAYLLTDLNYVGITDEEQRGLIEDIRHVLDTIDVRHEVTVMRGIWGERFYGRSDSDDRMDGFLGAVDEKGRKYRKGDKRGGVSSVTFLTVVARSAREIEMMEGALVAAFSRIGEKRVLGTVIRRLSTDERMQMMQNLTRCGAVGEKPFSYDGLRRACRDWRDAVRPFSFCAQKDGFRMNGMWGRCYVVEGLPGRLENDILTCICETECASVVSLCSERVEAGALRGEIRRKLASVGLAIENQKKRNRRHQDYFEGADSKTMRKRELLEELRDEVESGEYHYFSTTIVIVLLAETEVELEKCEEKLLSDAGLKGLEISRVLLRQKEALVTALPLGAFLFKREFLLSSRALAQFVPYRAQELFEEDGICYGRNQITMQEIRADKRAHKRHNELVLGQTHAGKSGFVKLEMLQIFRKYGEDRIIVIDPQGEYVGIAEKLGGSVISFAAGERQFLNPLDVDFSGMDYGETQEVIGEKADFIISLLGAFVRRGFSAEEMGLLSRVIYRVYGEYFERYRSQKHDTSVPTCSVTFADATMTYQSQKHDTSVPTCSVTFAKATMTDQVGTGASHFCSPLLQDIYLALEDERTAMAHGLAMGLDVFVNGALDIFNHRTNVDLDNRFLVINLKGMKANLRAASMLVMMEVAKGIIEDGWKSGRWTHLYIDEMHELLGVDAVAEYVKKLWKEVRKMRGVLTGITQNMSDLMDEAGESGNRLGPIFSNTGCFVLMAQSAIDKRMLMEMLPQVSRAMFSYVDGAQPGCGLLILDDAMVAFDARVEKGTEVYEDIQTD